MPAPPFVPTFSGLVNMTTLPLNDNDEVIRQYGS